MDLTTSLYLYDICINLSVGLIVAAMLGFVVYIVSACTTINEEHTTFHISIVLFTLFVILVNAFIPSGKTIASMYIIPELIKNEKSLELNNPNTKELREAALSLIKDIKREYNPIEKKCR